MWAESTITIVFKGLLVFHRGKKKDGRSFFEIGLLHLLSEGHIPRINTIKNCVLFDTKLLEDDIGSTSRRWRLEIDNPIGGGASVYQSDSAEYFCRHVQTDERDFRWIIDLESWEFCGRDLTDDMNTHLLRPILTVPYGVFYTRLKSPALRRKIEGMPPTSDQDCGDYGDDFGCFAGAIGCDIPMIGDGGVRLMAEDYPNDPIFTFNHEPNVIYEYVNTPPDVGMPDMTAPPDQSAADHADHPPATIETPDHFQNYYKMFPDDFTPKYRFELPKIDSKPDPNPALCGVIFLGQRSGPLD